MIRKASFRWHWMPTAVLLLGMLSAALLVWTDRINEKERINYLWLDAIMDVQIHTATFHLWFEQVLAGDTAVDMVEVWEDYDRADALVDVLLFGGESEHGLIPEPLNAPGLKVQAEGLKSLLSSFKTLALARMREPGKAGIGSDIDHRFDKVFEQVLTNAAGLELIVQDEQARIRREGRRLFWGILSAWTAIVLVSAFGLLSRERRRKASEEALLSAHEQLLSQSEELKHHREHLTEQVELRTRELTSANKSLELEIVGHRRTEDALKDSQKQLRQLSSRLLSAQEEERKKISRELHDELGQSLTLMKFRLRSVEKQLREDQGALKEEAGNILLYLNTVIEDVRRLSKDLCPFILEDLGLTRALQWLVDNFSKNNPDIGLTLDLPDMDGLFPQDAQTSIYRILQEALTNMVKHSGAGKGSVGVRKEAGVVSFSIEDDGKGFSVKDVKSQDAAERGLGLASMEERVRMLGGSLALWSEPGKGTRISFSIPADGTDRSEAYGEDARSQSSAMP
jgi:signal transduction histidine kinase